MSSAIEELRKQLDQESIEDEDPSKQLSILEGKFRAVHIQGLQDKFQLRKNWSSWIIGWITSLLIFNGVLAIWVGTGFSAFGNFEWFVTSLIVQIALQIIGLGYVAARFLFSDGGLSD